MEADYKFTTDESGQITGLVLVTPHANVPMPVPDSASFASSGTSVTETIAGDRVTRTITYTQDGDNATIYHLSSESVTLTTPAQREDAGGIPARPHALSMEQYYSFTITDGQVTSAAATFSYGDLSHSFDLTTIPTSMFTATSTGVTETLVLGSVVETIKYAPGTMEGHYDLVSDTKVFLNQDSQFASLNVSPYERDQFTFDTSGNLTDMKIVMLNGMTVDAPSLPNVNYSQLAPGFVLQTLTMSGYSSYELFYDGNGDGTYMAVANGSGATVDLVAIQAQLTTAGLTGIV